MRSWRAGLAAALLVLGACGGGDEPAGSVSGGPLEASLLSAAQLEGYVSPPSGIVEVSPDELGFTEGPDPRTPCGGTVELPPLDETEVAAFTWSGSPRGALFQIVWELPEPAATRVFEAFDSDIRPGCPPYVSRTPTGTQRVRFLGEVDLEDPPGAYVEGAYLSLRVSEPGGQVVETAAVVGIARRGGRLSLVISFAEDRLASAWVAGVIEGTAGQL